MRHIPGYGDVPDNLSNGQVDELGRIMADGARRGGWGAIPAAKREVEQKLEEMRHPCGDDRIFPTVLW